MYGLGTGCKWGCFEKEGPRESSGETGREQTRKTFVVVGKGLRRYPRSSPIYGVCAEVYLTQSSHVEALTPNVTIGGEGTFKNVTKLK